MPTIVGMRRRGYTPEAIRAFCDRIGVAKRENMVDVALLEHAVREDLNRRAPRVMGVLDPLRVVIENYPEAQSEEFEIANNPEDACGRARGTCRSRACSTSSGTTSARIRRRSSSVSRPGREVRLRGAYFITCTGVVKDPASGRSSSCAAPTIRRRAAATRADGRKVKSTLHWVSAAHAVGVEVRLYDRLFTSENPGAIERLSRGTQPAVARSADPNCWIEPSVAGAAAGHALPVRAARLLLRRSPIRRQAAWCSTAR